MAESLLASFEPPLVVQVSLQYAERDAQIQLTGWSAQGRILLEVLSTMDKITTEYSGDISVCNPKQWAEKMHSLRELVSEQGCLKVGADLPAAVPPVPVSTLTSRRPLESSPASSSPDASKPTQHQAVPTQDLSVGTSSMHPCMFAAGKSPWMSQGWTPVAPQTARACANMTVSQSRLQAWRQERMRPSSSQLQMREKQAQPGQAQNAPQLQPAQLKQPLASPQPKQSAEVATTRSAFVTQSESALPNLNYIAAPLTTPVGQGELATNKSAVVGYYGQKALQAKRQATQVQFAQGLYRQPQPMQLHHQPQASQRFIKKAPISQNMPCHPGAQFVSVTLGQLPNFVGVKEVQKKAPPLSAASLSEQGEDDDNLLLEMAELDSSTGPWDGMVEQDDDISESFSFSSQCSRPDSSRAVCTESVAGKLGSARAAAQKVHMRKDCVRLGSVPEASHSFSVRSGSDMGR